MEFIKSFLKLPESERQKVHEAILLLENVGSINTASTPAAEPNSSINSSADLFDLIKGIPVKNPPNQKTLDKWIVKKKPPQCTDVPTLDIEKASMVSANETPKEGVPNLPMSSSGLSTTSNFKEYNEEHLMSEINKKELKVLINRQECLETSKFEDSTLITSTDFLCDVSDSSSNNIPVSEVNKDASIIESSELENLMPLKQKVDNDSQTPERSYNLRSARRASDDKYKAEVKTLNSQSNSKDLSSVLNDNSACKVSQISEDPIKSDSKIKSKLKNFVGKKVTHVKNKPMPEKELSIEINPNCNSKIEATTDSCQLKEEKLMESVNDSYSVESGSNENFNVNSTKITIVQDSKKKVSKRKNRKMHNATKNTSPIKTNNASSTIVNEESVQDVINNTEMPTAEKKDGNHAPVIPKTKIAKKVRSDKKVFSAKKNINSSVCLQQSPKNVEVNHTEQSAQLDKDNLTQSEVNNQKNLQICSVHTDSNLVNKVNIPNELTNLREGSSTVPEKRNKSCSENIKKKNDLGNLELSLEVPTSDVEGKSTDVSVLKSVTPEEVLPSEEQICENILQKILSDNSDSLSIEESSELIDIPCEKKSFKRKKSIQLSPEQKEKPHKKRKIEKTVENNSAVMKMESKKNAKGSNVKISNSRGKNITSSRKSITKCNEEKPTNLIPESCFRRSNRNKLQPSITDFVIPSSVSEPNLSEVMSNTGTKLKNKNSNLSKTSKDCKTNKKLGIATEKNSSKSQEESVNVEIPAIQQTCNVTLPEINSDLKTAKNNLFETNCGEEKTYSNLQHDSLHDSIPSSVSEPNLSEIMSNTGTKSKNKNSNLSKTSKDCKTNKKLGIATEKNSSKSREESVNVEIPAIQQTCNVTLPEINRDLKTAKNNLFETNYGEEKTYSNLQHDSIELDEEMNRNYAAFCKISKILDALKIDIGELFQNQTMESSLKHISNGIFIIKKYDMDIKDSVNIYMHESKEELKNILQNLNDK